MGKIAVTFGRFTLMSKVPKFQFEDYPPAKPAKVANLHPEEASPLATLARGKNKNQLLYPLAETPQANPPERILTCADCDFYKYQGPNPRQGWGHCTFKK